MQSPKESSQWFSIFKVEEEREIYTESIGNLTVLLGTKNSSGGNQDFEYKKNVYKDSAIKHNQQLATVDNWNEEAIKNRAEKLYETFIKIW